MSKLQVVKFDTPHKIANGLLRHKGLAKVGTVYVFFPLGKLEGHVSVHTFGMRMPIRVQALDSNFQETKCFLLPMGQEELLPLGTVAFVESNPETKVPSNYSEIIEKTYGLKGGKP